MPCQLLATSKPLRYFQHEQGWKESPWSYISWHALYCISAKEIICPTQESLNSKRYVNIKSCTIPNKFFEQKTGRLASVRANNPFCRRHGYRGNNQYLPNTLAGHGYSSRQVLRPKNRAKGTSETHRQQPPPPPPPPPAPPSPPPPPPIPPHPSQISLPYFSADPGFSVDISDQNFARAFRQISAPALCGH